MRGAAISKFDLAVIGAGAAGLSVTYAAARFGLRVALIERGEMGGECLNIGCVPSKALLAAARAGKDFAEAKALIKDAIAAIAPADSVARYTALGAVVIKGSARFTGPRSLEVDGAPLSAKRIVIATGSRPSVPAFCDGLPYLTNETVWDMPALPAHLLILGGGPMAFEMADAFNGLGAKVTIIGGPVFLPREDAELAAPVIAALRGRGVAMIAQRAVAAKAGPVLVLDDGSEIAGSALLIAAGRRVDVSGLNLPAAGIQAGPDGILTDRGLRSLGNKHVYAAGDVANPAGIGPRRFTHVAGYHASVIIRRALFRLPAKLSPLPPVRVTYTAPELAYVGELPEQGGKTLKWQFAENDRAIAENDTVGLVKLVLDKKNRLIGAGITGKNAGEMIGLYALMIAEKTKLSALAGLMLPYPTRSEAGKRAVGAMLGEKLFSRGPASLVKLLALLP
jgi:pyruvate/2-oxoglutarate dehydrogenase complex dihydrolipoamide dehydrogenase (E3) component